MGICLLIICLFESLFARIVHIPAEFDSIQEGLDSLSENDTLMVALGTYEEALIAPAISFTMLGEVDSMLGERVQPVIDIANLELPDSTPLLVLQRSSSAIIRDFYFRNGGRDCIRSWADGTVISNCIIDSAYYGFNQKQDSIGAIVRLEACDFRSVLFTGVIVRYGNTLLARLCKFSSFESGMRSLVNVSSSILDSCEFSCDGGMRLLSASRGPHTVKNCTFGPAIMSPFESAVSIGDTMPIFINNTILDCVYGNHAVRIGAVLPDSARIAGNTFIRCTGLNVGQMAAGALGILYTTSPTGRGALIFGNSFVECAGYVTADDIWPYVGYPALIENNRFVHDSLNGLPSIGGSGGPWQGMPHTMRNNVFVDCGYALDGSAQTDARFNYWGDASGPYHETDNPLGLGDTITGPVQFIPWLTDTITSADDVVALPESIALTVYPNPFNSTAMLFFELKQGASSAVIVYDLLGREVWRSAEEFRTLGSHRIEFDANSLASGIYFAKLVTPQHTSVTKAVLIR